MRTVLNAVVRAPIAPTRIRRSPFTTRHTRSKWSMFCTNFGLAGLTTCGFSAVNLRSFW